MATKLEPDNPSSPTNDESEQEPVNPRLSLFYMNNLDGEAQHLADLNHLEQKDIKPPINNVADILKRLQSTGALITKPKQEFRCHTCEEDFHNWEELENHLIQHVQLPSVVLDKLPSDDEDSPPSGDENWSDEDETPPPPQTPTQKIDISQILKKTGISIKKPNVETDKTPNSALNKLSGLGFTIKKSITPIKKEPDPELPKSDDVLKKLGSLGGIKLKLKSAGTNNSFKVVNGLKDFKASDDEEEGSGNEESKDDPEADDDEHDKSVDAEGSAAENDSADEQADRKNYESDDSDKTAIIDTKIANVLKNLQGKTVASVQTSKTPIKTSPLNQPVKEVQQTKLPGRPAIKQTPKRGANLPIASKEIIQQRNDQPLPALIQNPALQDRRQSRDTSLVNVTVKQEVDTSEPQSTNVPLFSGQIKSERNTPPPNDATSTPIIASVKTELETPGQPIPPAQPLFSSQSIAPLLPVTKTEDTGPTIIEINGDSNDEDDDCCVVSATPAPDVKPIVPKIENPPTSYPTSSYSTSQPSYGTSNVLPSRLVGSLEKQHNFNWNAPDSKPPLDMLEKSAEDIFESLLSSSTKKENHSLSDASEYISLDTLGPQHSCDICNTRFTDISLLEEHRRMTGHSRSLVAPASSTLLPYSPSSSILSSLLPVKQIADQVGKLSVMGGNGPGFTHQQNVMINIQAYPGAGGVMPPQSYNSYAPGQNMPPSFAPGTNNMYGGPGQTIPGQYPGQNYIGPQGYGQYQTPMSSANYPGPMPQSPYSAQSSQYSSASPLQGMQNTVYGQQSATVGQMGPPSSTPYIPVSSSGGSMKPPTSSGVRIQNVQTFSPGQLPGMPGQNMSGGQDISGQPTALGQVVGGQMPPPSTIRMSSGAMGGTRPRMPNVRGIRPSIRPGIQVQGQIRGAKPGARMPMKRPANMPINPGMKKRPNMLLPDKHDNEDCQVMAMQKQRDGLPMIHSVQGAKDKINLGSQISITKKTVNKEASAMANVLASRGISIKQKQKSRSPSPERPIPHIPNLGAGMSIKHTSKTSSFSIPEAKVGGGMMACKICKKMFMNYNSLSVHVATAHPQNKLPVFKCDECPASYPKSLQLQHHKRVFHNVSGPNREYGLPVVDLSQEDSLKRLSNLGIYSFIPLANREQAGGCFGIPVISVHNMQNGLTNSLQGLGADGLLSLGPLKPLPNS